MGNLILILTVFSALFNILSGVGGGATGVLQPDAAKLLSPPTIEQPPLSYSPFDMQCEKCRVRFYGSVWELVFEAPDGWEAQRNEYIESVVSANGKQWYMFSGKEFPISSITLREVKTGDMIGIGLGKDLDPPSIPPPTSVSEFRGAGWKGKLYLTPLDYSRTDRTLFFSLPDNKFKISISSTDKAAFDTFVKGIKLEK